MDKITAKLILVKPAILDNSKDISSFYNKMYDDLIQDIYNLTLSIPSSLSNIQLWNLNFKYIKYPQKNLHGRKIGTLYISHYVDLKDIDITCETICGKIKKLENITNLETKKELLIFEFEQILYNIIFALNLSYGGLLNISEGSCFYGKSAFYINNKKCRNTNFGGLPSDCMYIDPLINIKSIPLKKTWNWLHTKTHFIEGKTQSRIDKALNALTYLYDCRAYEDIFYSLMSIEALYNRGEGNIREQIENKVRYVLGDFYNIHTIIKNIYYIRSDFFHGRFRLTQNHCDEYFISKDTKKYYEAVNTALLIIIATIQKMIINNCSSVEELLELKL
ncbi:MAG: hypothetical protein E7017_05560 [Alphaproteobacteria bacterium]|nr:hypothetical protein [Alphaproteobacteria bacterium]